MTDILLGRDGDIKLTDRGDISLTESVKQAILIRLRWFWHEWRLGPELGFPWFEEVLVKNPNIPKIRGLLRNEIMQVNGVLSATIDKCNYNAAERQIRVQFTVNVPEEIIREEVLLYV